MKNKLLLSILTGAAAICLTLVTACTQPPVIPAPPPEEENPPEEEIPSDKLEFKMLDDKKSYALVNLGKYEKTSYTIPSSYENLPVTEIGDSVFKGRVQLTEIIIPDQS